MKLAKHDNKLLTNTNNESQDFGIGNASVVIEILRNRLYKHKIRTSVQEYISNGRDATREVKSKRPIEITCPTMLEPVFKVRDFGPGISPDRMLNVFIQYGASTKRDSNNQIGGFGIGAKSAWSYTDSFNIVTHIDGIKREYLAHTGVNNNGRLETLSESTTNEPNGTEIIIAVNPKDIQEFKSAIERCLFFWPKKDYKLTNMPDTLLKSDYKFNQIGQLKTFRDLPDCISRNNYGWNRDIFLSIDGIPYNIKELKDKINSLNKLHDLVVGTMVISIPNGLIEVSANREEVTDSQITISELTNVCDRLLIEVQAHIKGLFKGITEPKEYLQTYMDNLGLYELNAYRQFKGYKFSSDTLELVNGNEVTLYSCYWQSDRFYKKEIKPRYRDKTLRVNQLDRIFYHTGVLSLVKLGQKLREKCTELNKGIVLIEPGINKKVFDETIKDLNASDIDLVQLPVKPKQTKRQKRDSREICMHYYPNYYKQTKHVKIKDVSDTWYYVNHDSINHRHKDIAKYLNINICGLSQSSIDLVKNNKFFKPLKPVLDNYKPKQTEINSVWKKRRSTNQGIINFLNDCKVKDKTLKGYLKTHKALHNVKEFELPNFLIEKIESMLETKQLDNQVLEFDKYLKDNYSLLDDVSLYKKSLKNDIEIYFNAKQKEVNNG